LLRELPVDLEFRLDTAEGLDNLTRFVIEMLLSSDDEDVKSRCIPSATARFGYELDCRLALRDDMIGIVRHNIQISMQRTRTGRMVRATNESMRVVNGYMRMGDRPDKQAVKEDYDKQYMETLAESFPTATCYFAEVAKWTTAPLNRERPLYTQPSLREAPPREFALTKQEMRAHMDAMARYAHEVYGTVICSEINHGLARASWFAPPATHPQVEERKEAEKYSDQVNSVFSTLLAQLSPDEPTRIAAMSEHKPKCIVGDCKLYAYAQRKCLAHQKT
jgi:hypothetical protein